MSNSIDLYNFCAKNVEISFNKLGVMPFGIPIISGHLRALAGLVQKAVGVPFMLMGAIGYVATAILGCSHHVCREYRRVMLFGAEQVIHGSLNVFRGVFEAALSLATLGFGNLALIPLNKISQEEYAPIFSYGSFTGREVAYIPMPYGLAPQVAYY